MTRPGETFYRLVPDASKRHSLRGKTIDKSAQELTWQPLFGCLRRGSGGRIWPSNANGSPKQYLSIGNQTILEHSVHACWRIPG